jgi:hypothetical protein
MAQHAKPITRASDCPDVISLGDGFHRYRFKEMSDGLLLQKLDVRPGTTCLAAHQVA